MGKPLICVPHTQGRDAHPVAHQDNMYTILSGFHQKLGGFLRHNLGVTLTGNVIPVRTIMRASNGYYIPGQIGIQ